jgi:hypothetical protein
VAEGGALLRRYGGLILHRGFESLLLRRRQGVRGCWKVELRSVARRPARKPLQACARSRFARRQRSTRSAPRDRPGSRIRLELRHDVPDVCLSSERRGADLFHCLFPSARSWTISRPRALRTASRSVGHAPTRALPSRRSTQGRTSATALAAHTRLAGGAHGHPTRLHRRVAVFQLIAAGGRSAPRPPILPLPQPRRDAGFQRAHPLVVSASGPASSAKLAATRAGRYADWRPEGWQSGRMRRSRKPFRGATSDESSNLSPSALRAKTRANGGLLARSPSDSLARTGTHGGA